MPFEAEIHYASYAGGVPTEANAHPERTLLLLHGIYGSGRNWHSFAKDLSQEYRGWGIVTVDLRKHGRSQSAPPPHTVQACAQDLLDLQAREDWSVRAVSGHSFGGKVAITFADAQARWGTGPVEHLWILDSDPGAHPAGVPRSARGAVGVLEILRGLPATLFESRADFRSALGQHGIPRAMADWLGMNLARSAEGYRLQMDLDALGQLLDDYLALDLWPTLDAIELAAGLHFVIGGQSPVVSLAQRERVAALDASQHGVTCDVLESAGHRLHVDDPTGLFGLFQRYGG